MPDDPGVRPPDYPKNSIYKDEGPVILLLRFLLLVVAADIIITVVAQYYG